MSVMKNRFCLIDSLVICCFLIGLIGFVGCRNTDYSSSRKEEVRPGGLFSDVVKVRNHEHTNPLNITSVVQKYIPIGTSKQNAIRYLTQNGFKISSGIRPNTLIAFKNKVRNQSSPLEALLYSGYSDYIITIELRKDRVKRVEGEVVYHFL